MIREVQGRLSRPPRCLSALAFLLFLAPIKGVTSSQSGGLHIRVHRNHEPSEQESQLSTAAEDVAQSQTNASLHPLHIADKSKGCAFTAGFDRMVLVAGEWHDITWLKELEVELELPYIQYQSRDPLEPHYYVNNANEAGAYLRFIHEYYDCLPAAVAFIHGHGAPAWHSNDMSEVLKAIEWETVPNYIDINKYPNDTWRYLGDARPRPGNPVAYAADVYNGSFNLHQVIGGIAYDSWSTHLWLMDQAYIRGYDKFFGPAGFGEMPGVLRITCCAQFVVRREAIRLRPRSYYKKALDYLANHDIRGNNLRDARYVIGDVFSVYWSMTFGAADITPMYNCSTYPDNDKPTRCCNH